MPTSYRFRQRTYECFSVRATIERTVLSLRARFHWKKKRRAWRDTTFSSQSSTSLGGGARIQNLGVQWCLRAPKVRVFEGDWGLPLGKFRFFCIVSRDLVSPDIKLSSENPFSRPWEILLHFCTNFETYFSEFRRVLIPPNPPCLRQSRRASKSIFTMPAILAARMWSSGRNGNAMVSIWCRRLTRPGCAARSQIRNARANRW